MKREREKENEEKTKERKLQEEQSRFDVHDDNMTNNTTAGAPTASFLAVIRRAVDTPKQVALDLNKIITPKMRSKKPVRYEDVTVDTTTRSKKEMEVLNPLLSKSLLKPICHELACNSNADDLKNEIKYKFPSYYTVAPKDTNSTKIWKKNNCEWLESLLPSSTVNNNNNNTENNNNNTENNTENNNTENNNNNTDNNNNNINSVESKLPKALNTNNKEVLAKAIWKYLHALENKNKSVASSLLIRNLNLGFLEDQKSITYIRSYCQNVYFVFGNEETKTEDQQKNIQTAIYNIAVILVHHLFCQIPDDDELDISKLTKPLTRENLYKVLIDDIPHLKEVLDSSDISYVYLPFEYESLGCDQFDLIAPLYEALKKIDFSHYNVL